MATQAAVALQPNEEKLIRAGQRGDEKAVENFIPPLPATVVSDGSAGTREHRGRGRRAARRAALGVSQSEAIRRAVAVFTWLTRIVINAALMRRRSAKSRPAVSLDETPREDELPAAERFADDGPNPEQVFASTEIREMISENLDELSPLLRTAFVLREVQGYSTGEAAKKLGVTENTLKARLWRARHQLAERWDGVCADEGRHDRGMGDPECSYC